MDLETLRAYPVVGALFHEPAGNRVSWALFALALAFTAYLSFARGLKVGLPAGGGLVLMGLSEVLPERRHRTAVAVRFLGIGVYLALWVVTLVYFPSAPAFFEGDW